MVGGVAVVLIEFGSSVLGQHGLWAGRPLTTRDVMMHVGRTSHIILCKGKTTRVIIALTCDIVAKKGCAAIAHEGFITYNV